MKDKIFDIYSRYYDLLNKDKNYIEETLYVDSLIKSFLPQGNTILELGCGTAIHAQLLAEKGYSIHGIDSSETMLLKAKNRILNLSDPIPGKLSFSLGDIRTYKNEDKYDVIISLFHVISYMTTKQDLESVIKTVKKHLNKNGLFIFDCWHADGVLNDKPISRIKSVENEFISVKRTSLPTLLDENRVDVNFDIEIYDKQTKQSSKLNELHQMRYWYTEELQGLLNSYDLEVINKEEWLTKKELTQNSWYACYVFRNKN